MENLTIATSIFFLIADALAIAALRTPNWIVTEFSGITKLGLTEMCITFRGQKTVCGEPKLPNEWVATLVFIVIGIILITLALLMIFFSLWNENLLAVARWISYSGTVLFCVAAVMFPFGLYIPEIGGEAYKLTSDTKIGFSYYLFFTAVFFSAMSCSLNNLFALHFNFL